MLCYSSFGRTGMAGVPGTANAIFAAVKDVGANVIMISQVYSPSDFILVTTCYVRHDT